MTKRMQEEFRRQCLIAAAASEFYSHALFVCMIRYSNNRSTRISIFGGAVSYAHMDLLQKNSSARCRVLAAYRHGKRLQRNNLFGD